VRQLLYSLSVYTLSEGEVDAFFTEILREQVFLYMRPPPIAWSTRPPSDTPRPMPLLVASVRIERGYASC